MDGHQFDAIVKLLSTTGARRPLLSGLVGLTLGGLSRASDAAARRKHKRRRTQQQAAPPKCKPSGTTNRSTCAKNTQCCSDRCYQKKCCTPNCAGRTCGASDDCGGTCPNGSCPSGQTCGGGGIPDVCGNCTANSDCDDGVACTDDACVNGVCTNPVNHGYCRTTTINMDCNPEHEFADPDSGCVCRCGHCSDGAGGCCDCCFFFPAPDPRCV